MPPKRSPKKGKKLRKGKGSRNMGLESKRSKGFTKNVSRVLGGTEDVEETILSWEYIISSAIAASSDATYAFKGNSIYRPGGIASIGLGLTTNPVGYARLFTQYRLAMVISSTMSVEAWASSGTITAGVPTGNVISVPLRAAIVPANSFAAITYAGQNTASIGGYPHSTTAFSNNTVRVRSRGSNALLLTGEGKASNTDSSPGVYSATTGADPALLWYYVLGLGNGSAALNATTFEARVRISYKVRFYEAVAMDVQLAKVDRFGGEYDVASTPMGEHKNEHKAAVIKLTQAEAFEDWGDVDSEFAAFKEQCLVKRKAMRQLDGVTAAAVSTAAAPKYAPSGSPVGLLFGGKGACAAS